ncbi:MAG: phosphatase PAP2 family protein [Chitinophagales bacterium]|nr:phosphatase PAP2 family protein [Chitinophagales bacterium]
MLEQLIEWDRTLFYLVNSVWVNSFFDSLLPWLRDKYTWTPLYVFIVSFFVLNYKQRGVFAMLYLGIAVLFCDQISSDIIKPLVGRLRPCNDPLWDEYMRLLVRGCGSGFSFTSSHAANHFGVATFLGIVVWQYSKIILPIGFLWAALVCYAQVYVGVHYPLDITGGGVLGIFIGGGMSALFSRHFKTLVTPGK